MDNWHAKLIAQMSVPLGGREAVVSHATRLGLNELRSSRHFLRNDYGAVLDQERIVELGKVAVTIIESFEQDWKCFKARCFGENVANQECAEGPRETSAAQPKTKKPDGCSM